MCACLIIYHINNVCVALSYHTLFDGHNSLQIWRQVGQNFTFFVLKPFIKYIEREIYENMARLLIYHLFFSNSSKQSIYGHNSLQTWRQVGQNLLCFNHLSIHRT